MFAFLKLGSEIGEAERGSDELVTHLDRSIMELSFSLRNDGLTKFAGEVTALGSTIVLTIFTCIGTAILILKRRWSAGLQLASVALTAGLVTRTAKAFFERERPSDFPMLAQVGNLSYPSGHSLASTAIYFTLALIVGKTFAMKSRRYLCLSLIALLPLAIGLTRIYLGVHYPSDVAAGIMVGLALALTGDEIATHFSNRSPTQ